MYTYKEKGNTNPSAYMIEIETPRDTSRRRSGEVRLFASVFFHISKNATGRKKLDKIYVIIADPFEYPQKPSLVKKDFIGKNKLANARHFIATINEEFNLRKPIANLCWENLTECVIKLDDANDPREYIEYGYEYLEWVKNYIKRYDELNI